MTELPENWDEILEPGEKLLWQGRPDGSAVWQRRHILPVLLGFGVACLGLIWIFLVSDGNIYTAAMGLILIVLGAFLGLAPPIMSSMVRKASWYSLSNKRAFIAMHRKSVGRKLAAYRIDPEFELLFDYKDPATIIFAIETRQPGNAAYTVKIGFEQIRDGEKVYQMLRDIQAGKL